MGQDSVEPTYERSEANEVSILPSPGRPDNAHQVEDMRTGSRRCRSVTRRVERPADRAVWRRVWRAVSRSRSRQTWRRVLPSDGVTLGTICRLLTAYIRLATRHEKKRNPPVRFKKWDPPVGSRSFQADLERVYGDAACAAQENQTPACDAENAVVTVGESSSIPAAPAAPKQPAPQIPVVIRVTESRT